MMVDDIRPETNIEWLWTLDLVELCWEILRYRRLKKRILDAHRVAAIEAILQRLDGEGMSSEAMPMVQTRVRQAAAEWRNDQEAAIEIEARLDRTGLDAIDSGAGSRASRQRWQTVGAECTVGRHRAPRGATVMRLSTGAIRRMQLRVGGRFRH
jgi:hypothetical protein